MIRIFLALAALVFAVDIAHGAPAVPQGPAAPSFDEWRAQFRAEALAAGRAPAAVSAILDGTTYRKDVVWQDRHQYEVIAPLNKFFADVTSGTTLADGRAAYARDKAVFDAVAARYGVDAYPILGIWANESRYGKLIRPFPIAASIATLAYDTRRQAYFSNELMSLIRMQELGVPGLPAMTGSWAGALGQPQFEPSDYLQYAVDFDGDGKRDIWTSEGDVIASIANFLHRNGWQHGLAWGEEVSAPQSLLGDETLMRAPGAACKASDALSRRLTVAAWRKLGVLGRDGTSAQQNAALPDSAEASLLSERHLSGRVFLVSRNFETILRYNCSLQYALTAALVSDLVLGATVAAR